MLNSVMRFWYTLISDQCKKEKHCKGPSIEHEMAAILDLK